MDPIKFNNFIFLEIIFYFIILFQFQPSILIFNNCFIDFF